MGRYRLSCHVTNSIASNNSDMTCVSVMPLTHVNAGIIYLTNILTFISNITPRGEWADPGGTAIPGQPVGKSEQAIMYNEQLFTRTEKSM